RVAGDRGPLSVEDDPGHLAVVHRSGERGALALRAEAAAVAERDAGDADRAWVEELRQDRVRSVLVRVAGGSPGAGLARPPAVVLAAPDPVDLVVAGRPVLRFPQLVGLRIEGEAERVPDPERPHAIAERAVARDAGEQHRPANARAVTIPVPQDLVAETAARGTRRVHVHEWLGRVAR